PDHDVEALYRLPRRTLAEIVEQRREPHLLRLLIAEDEELEFVRAVEPFRIELRHRRAFLERRDRDEALPLVTARQRLMHARDRRRGWQRPELQRHLHDHALRIAPDI